MYNNVFGIARRSNIRTNWSNFPFYLLKTVLVALVNTGLNPVSIFSGRSCLQIPRPCEGRAKFMWDFAKLSRCSSSPLWARERYCLFMSPPAASPSPTRKAQPDKKFTESKCMGSTNQTRRVFHLGPLQAGRRIPPCPLLKFLCQSLFLAYLFPKDVKQIFCSYNLK